MDIHDHSRNVLYRSIDHRAISGVCYGLAEYFRVDVTIIRFIFIASLLFSYYTIILYVAGAVIIPKNPMETEMDDQDVKSIIADDKTILVALVAAALGFIVLWFSFAIPSPLFNYDFPSKLIVGLLLVAISFYFFVKRFNDPDIQETAREKYMRIKTDKLISGVLTGFAKQYRVDVSIVRLLVIIFCLLEPFMFILLSIIYLSIAFLVPYIEDKQSLDSD